MTIKIIPNDKENPPGKLADAELHFTEGELEGLELIGFAVWERRSGTGRNVTFPARQYSVNGERRSFALLRPILDATAQERSPNLAALDRLMDAFHPELLFVESGGDNLAAQFSRELADYTIYVIDVVGGDRIPRKGGPGITQSICWSSTRPISRRSSARISASWSATRAACGATDRSCSPRRRTTWALVRLPIAC